MKNTLVSFFILLLLSTLKLGYASSLDDTTDELKETYLSTHDDELLMPDDGHKVTVWGKSDDSKEDSPSPASILTQEDMQSINLATTEDVVKFEPSLVIRRRFIGDSNGTLGIRGSNMFQTSRSMVFADGVPLHYLLQSRWSGAPRWSLVSASEIAMVEVLYGPFSAEYSGNSMGGVVLIETGIPQSQEIHFDVSYFTQAFDDYGYDDSVDGYKGFFSYGNKIDDLSIYFSYNHLQNDSQPQSFYYGGSSNDTNPTLVSGAIEGDDYLGNPQLYFGDSGVENTQTHNYKLKLGYEFGDWMALLNLAYEDRASDRDSPNSYVIAEQNNPTANNQIWAGHVVQNGQAFFIPASRLNVNYLERDSMSLGLRLKGELKTDVHLEANINQFKILRDTNFASLTNPDNPTYSLDGQITDYDNTGWQTGEIKLTIDNWLTKNLTLVSGIRSEAYELAFNVYNSDDYIAGNKTSYSSRSGGESSVWALYSQANWQVTNSWSVTLGARYEDWQSKNGYFAKDNPTTPEFDLEYVPETSADKVSPKFSTRYELSELWQIKYSLAKAYRFPIVEELFSQYQAFNAISEANPELKPEDGTHQNISLDYKLTSGYLRLNLFNETIENVIESQSTILPGGGSIRTFIPVDQVETLGAEFIANQQGLWSENLDFRFNMTYTDSEIVENKADLTLEGNQFPRMPRWRANLLATYHLSESLNIGSTIQYASNSFGRINNADIANHVYGAQDRFFRLGLKTNFDLNQNFRFSLGVENLTNEIAYVAHPWPARTYFINFAYSSN